jgi:hypothetical protein
MMADSRAGRRELGLTQAELGEQLGVTTNCCQRLLPAFPTKEFVRTLRRRGVKASVDRALTIKRVFYAGDEGGIICDVTPSQGAKEVFLVSLTHLRIAPNHPLFAPGLST